MFIIIVFRLSSDNALLLVLRRISSVLSQGITGCDSSHGSFCRSKMILHFTFMHLLSGYFYYDYVIIGVLRPSRLN